MSASTTARASASSAAPTKANSIQRCRISTPAATSPEKLIGLIPPPAKQAFWPLGRKQPQFNLEPEARKAACDSTRTSNSI